MWLVVVTFSLFGLVSCSELPRFMKPSDTNSTRYFQLQAKNNSTQISIFNSTQNTPNPSDIGPQAVNPAAPPLIPPPPPPPPPPPVPREMMTKIQNSLPYVAYPALNSSMDVQPSTNKEDTWKSALVDYTDIRDIQSCPVKLEPVGCYKDVIDSPGTRALPDEILNGRDKHNSFFVEPEVDWKNYDVWLANFYCKCALIAKRRGNTVIGGQFWAECWAGKGDFSKYGPASSCKTGRYAAVDGSERLFCVPSVGERSTNFIYRIAPTACSILYEPLGCFKDSQLEPRPLQHYIMNERDYNIENWNSILIDWKHWNTYLPEMICRCAEKAKKQNYDYFGIQFWGECWAGTQDEMKMHSYTRDGESSECRGANFDDCPLCNSYHCVGKARTNYVYKLMR